MDMIYRVEMEQPRPEQAKHSTLQETVPQGSLILRQRNRYNVYQLQEFGEQLGVNCNPQALTEHEDFLYPEEERLSVTEMIASRLDAMWSGDFLDCFTNAVHECVRFIRERMQERAVISYRDIDRVCPIFNRIASHCDDMNLQSTFQVCAAVSLMICFCLRLSEKIDLRKELVAKLERLLAIGEGGLEGTFRRFGFYYNWPLMKMQKVWKFASTFCHLLVMRICLECGFACFVVGKPGTSRSYAVELLDNPAITGDTRPYRIHKYISSQNSSPDGIQSRYFGAAFWSLTEPTAISAVFIQEMGMATLNLSQPLKSLHGILDHGIEVYGLRNRIVVPTIGVSNYELDFANMNRAIVVSTDLPAADELVCIFRYAELPASAKPWEADGANPEPSWDSAEFVGWYEQFDTLWRTCREGGSLHKRCLSALWQSGAPETIALRSLYAVIPILAGIRHSPAELFPKAAVELSHELINAQRLVRPGDVNDPELLRNLPAQMLAVVNSLVPGMTTHLKSNWDAFAERSRLGLFQKGLCVLTRNYEAVDFVKSMPGLDNPIVLFAEDFKRSASSIAFDGLRAIRDALADYNAPVVLIGHHPVLDSILDATNRMEIGASVLIASDFATVTKVTRQLKLFFDCRTRWAIRREESILASSSWSHPHDISRLA
jgi:hypothetical protein